MRLDLDQHVALGHHLALAHGDPLRHPGDTGGDLHDLVGFQGAASAYFLRQRPLGGCFGEHGHAVGRLGGVRRLATAGGDEQQESGDDAAHVRHLAGPKQIRVIVPSGSAYGPPASHAEVARAASVAQAEQAMESRPAETAAGGDLGHGQVGEGELVLGPA